MHTGGHHGHPTCLIPPRTVAARAVRADAKPVLPCQGSRLMRLAVPDGIGLTCPTDHIRRSQIMA
jgi:hypothetical protein